LHQDPPKVRVPLDRNPHQVPGLALEPVRGRPDRDDALDRLAVVEPHLQPHARRAFLEPQQVVVHREALRLRRRQARVTLRAGGVQVAPGGGTDVAGDALLAPAEVVGGGDVREEAEVELVAEVEARLAQPRGVDDERRLAVRLLRLDEARDARVVVQEATPRISYAGGTPASTFSCRRTMPSSSASGRGGHPGTWMST